MRAAGREAIAASGEIAQLVKRVDMPILVCPRSRISFNAA
jgi:hypothetical protein